MTGNMLRGTRNGDWWASTKAELDGKRKDSNLYRFWPLGQRNTLRLVRRVALRWIIMYDWMYKGYS
jgi:hypothetical protein